MKNLPIPRAIAFLPIDDDIKKLEMGACFPSSPGSMNKASCFPDTFRITPISTDAFGALAIQAERGGQDPLPIDLVLSREQNEIAPLLSCHT